MTKPELSIYPTSSEKIEIVPANFERQWMDDTPNRFAYRCIPLSIANASGWQMLNPLEFEAEWDGTDGKDAISITATKKLDIVKSFVMSHFGCGILTFQTGYIFKTPPGWATWLRGLPNTYKEGIFALDGVVETDWLPFTSTMNWKFTKPGKVKFETNEPFCFITLIPHQELDNMQPQIKVMDQKLFNDYVNWTGSRNRFINKLENNDSETIKQGWQKNYVQGETMTGEKATYHVSKRRLNPFNENF